MKLDYYYLFNFVDGTYDYVLDQERISELRDIPYNKVVAITSENRGRPDIVAFNELGDKDLSWFVLIYNDIVNPYTFDNRAQLYLPSISDLDEYVLNYLIQRNLS